MGTTVGTTVGTEENLGLNSEYGRELGTQQWLHKDSIVCTEENLGLNSGYIRTQQWVRKRTWDSTVGRKRTWDSTVGT